MWTRIGAAFVLFFGLISVMLQAVLLQGSPLAGAAFADCAIGCIGIFAASYMSRRAATLYLAVVSGRLLVVIALFTAFLATFSRQYLSYLLCKELTLLESDLASPSPEAIQAAELACQHAGVVIIVLVSLLFVLSVSLCWFPCFRCGLHFRESLCEREALEGLLNENDDDDVLRTLSSTATPSKFGTARERELAEEAHHQIVTPPLRVHEN